MTETIDGQVYYIGVRWQDWTEEVDSVRMTMTDEKTGKPWLKPIAGGDAPVCEWIARQIQQVRDLDLESLDS